MVAPIQGSSRRRAKPISDDALRAARERELLRLYAEKVESFKRELEREKALAPFEKVPDDTDAMIAAEIADRNMRRQDELRERMVERGKILGISEPDVGQALRDVFGKFNG